MMQAGTACQFSGHLDINSYHHFNRKKSEDNTFNYMLQSYQPNCPDIMFNVTSKKNMLFCRMLNENNSFLRYNIIVAYNAEHNIHVPRSLWLWRSDEGKYNWPLLGHQHLILRVGQLLSTIWNVAHTVAGLNLKHSIILILWGLRISEQWL